MAAFGRLILSLLSQACECIEWKSPVQNWILESNFFLLPVSLYYLGLLIQQLSLAIFSLMAKCD